MSNAVIRAFRTRVLEDARSIRDESSILRMVADPMSGDPPRRHHGLLTGVEHFERTPEGAFRATAEPIPFTLDFPEDYCSCPDGSLQLRVAWIHSPLVHPNRGPQGIVCLGGRFKPGTRLRPLLEHLYRICSGRVFASDSPMDARAAEFFRSHPEQVRALRAEPLWQAPIAASVRVELGRGAPPAPGSSAR